MKWPWDVLCFRIFSFLLRFKLVVELTEVYWKDTQDDLEHRLPCRLLIFALGIKPIIILNEDSCDSMTCCKQFNA